jgi:hypothetical protein
MPRRPSALPGQPHLTAGRQDWRTGGRAHPKPLSLFHQKATVSSPVNGAGGSVRKGSCWGAVGGEPGTRTGDDAGCSRSGSSLGSSERTVSMPLRRHRSVGALLSRRPFSLPTSSSIRARIPRDGRKCSSFVHGPAWIRTRDQRIMRTRFLVHPATRQGKGAELCGLTRHSTTSQYACGEVILYTVLHANHGL